MSASRNRENDVQKTTANQDAPQPERDVIREIAVVPTVKAIHADLKDLYPPETIPNLQQQFISSENHILEKTVQIQKNPVHDSPASGKGERERAKASVDAPEKKKTAPVASRPRAGVKPMEQRTSVLKRLREKQSQLASVSGYDAPAHLTEEIERFRK